MPWRNILTRKLQEHSKLSASDISAISSLMGQSRSLTANEDILRQGDKPTGAVVVVDGMIARYHTVSEGRRQYLSFHMAGDMPDVQAMFLQIMDHSLCALDKASIFLVPHKAILELFKSNPDVGAAFWKETLIDAAIFRQAITNNSGRDLETRMAHFFCELYYRADKSSLVADNSCRIPLTQTQLAETLASSLPSISRALIKLRKTKTFEFESGVLKIKDWNGLVRIGDFNADYLHTKKPI